jgi:hypothetical protein
MVVQEVARQEMLVLEVEVLGVLDKILKAHQLLTREELVEQVSQTPLLAVYLPCHLQE